MYNQYLGVDMNTCMIKNATSPSHSQSHIPSYITVTDVTNRKEINEDS